MERLGQVLVETYRVEKLIAEGGMAAVYEASHLRVPKRFAVKFLKLSLVNNAEALQRFRREAEIIATLDHPNIVQLIDYNITEDGAPYIVLEFLDGENLGQRLHRGKVPLLEALQIASAVASALATAHAREITHRDLKPENIMLCRGNKVKVLDFGVAKLRHGPELTAFNVVVGTVGYMAPEQVSGSAVDSRTDQFALATIVYHMLAGASPFEIEGSITAQALHILHHTPTPIDDVPDAVNEILLRALAKAPGDRFDSCEEMAQLLLAAAGHETDSHEAELPPLAAEPTAISAPPAPVTQATTDPNGVIVHRSLTVNGAPTQSLDREELLGAKERAKDPSQRTTLPPIAPAATAPTQATPQIPKPPPPRREDVGATVPPLGVYMAGPVPPPPAEDVASTLPPLTMADALSVTPRSMPAIPVPAEVTGRRTAPSGLPRAAWIAIGAAAGGSLALVIWLLVR
jgi:serine/threonine-protein kinase